MRTDFRGINKNEAIKEFFTIGNFEILFLILVVSIISAVYFMNKEDQLKARLGDKKDRILYFEESLSLLTLPIVFASLINFFIKASLFGINTDILVGKLKVPFHVIFNSSIYFLVIAFFAVAVSFLFQITMKPILTATLYPLFIFESLILIFGVSNLFVSNKIPGMMEFSNFTSGLVLKYLNMFMSGLRVEMLETEIFFVTILAFSAAVAACLAGTSRFIVTYNEKTLAHSYRSTFLRRLIIFVLVTLFTLYILIAIFAGYSMVVLESIPLDKAFEYTGILSIIIIAILTIVFEYFYMKRNNLIVKRENKSRKKNCKKNKNKNKSNVEVIKNIENNTQNLDVKINIDVKLNDLNLENKGIVKETVKTSYSPKIEEALDNEKLSLEAKFEEAVSKNLDDDNNGFEDLFFDEDIKIKESSSKIIVEKENIEDIKNNKDKIENTFFTEIEENK